MASSQRKIRVPAFSTTVAASTQATLSLREQLNEAVTVFLDEEGMTCPKTQEGLIALINALGYYTEEGQALFPEIFVFDSLEDVLRVLPESESVDIGEDSKRAATMTKALKKCAPLARRGWAIYIERRAKHFRYGLFRCGSTVVSLSHEELLVHKGDRSIPVFVLRQVARNTIQVKGVSQSSLMVYFGATAESDVSPVPSVNGFITRLVRDVPGEVQEQVASFYRTVLLGVLRAGHGTLAAVMPTKRKRTVPSAFRDGIIVRPPISLVSRVRDLLGRNDCAANTRLQASAALITGMLLSDGITLFGSDGSVRAYNIFIKHPRRTGGETGGARMRTYRVMADLLGSSLTGVFIQSQDGRVEFRGD